MNATTLEMDSLNRLYAGCNAYHGELHDHAQTGGTSDGRRPLSHWLGAMEALELDFAAILDHKQVRHMYLPEWKDGTFIGGTEPGTRISDSKASVREMHYNMLFSGPEPLEKLLSEFPEFEFSGGQEGHFCYPSFTTERFRFLIDAVKAHGGFFVYPHPMQLMQSADPCDYWFRDETGIEVFYGTMDSQHSADNYKLWVDLLALGKRVWACAGGDGHGLSSDQALTTLYAQDKTNASYLSHLRVGDFTCGPVGIRMCIGDTKTGGQCPFAGKRLIVCAGDFHKVVRNPEHSYQLVILNDQGIVCHQEISCEQPTYAALNTSDCAFYRAEIFDETRSLRIAVGNPIWNIRS